MFDDMLYILTHVASQLAYRWLPPPVVAPIDQSNWSSYFKDLGIKNSLSLADWRNLLANEIEGLCSSLSWLPRWIKFKDPNCEILVQTAHAWIESIKLASGHVLTMNQRSYPDLLRHIPDPPLALSVIGTLSNLHRPCEAIIGSRQASAYALKQSYLHGARLANAGIVVVSGGAIGCDIASHRGVLASQQSSAGAIVVFAGGLGKLYPRQNQRWFDELLAKGGTFVSERLWSAHCRPQDFRARNRIISGLSRRTNVMQASHNSGALITARLALDQGRDVAVLAHPPGDIRAAGGAELLSDGASLILSIDEDSFGLTEGSETV